jgi:hypothetical protein
MPINLSTLVNPNSLQLAKAWVNFNGTTATPSTIRSSYNVSSITKNATGDYTVNFATPMADANYTAVGASSPDSSNILAMVVTMGQTTSNTYQAPTTSTLRFTTRYVAGNDQYDPVSVNIEIFGN